MNAYNYSNMNISTLAEVHLKSSLTLFLLKSKEIFISFQIWSSYLKFKTKTEDSHPGAPYKVSNSPKQTHIFFSSSPFAVNTLRSARDGLSICSEADSEIFCQSIFCLCQIMHENTWENTLLWSYDQNYY